MSNKKNFTLGARTITPEELARYTCMDCGVNVIEIGEYYMAAPEIWDHKLKLKQDDNLCIGCLERRLGRRLSIRSGDFSSFPFYPWMKKWPTSERLLKRYGYKRKS